MCVPVTSGAGPVRACALCELGAFASRPLRGSSCRICACVLCGIPTACNLWCPHGRGLRWRSSPPKYSVLEPVAIQPCDFCKIVTSGPPCPRRAPRTHHQTKVSLQSVYARHACSIPSSQEPPATRPHTQTRRCGVVYRIAISPKRNVEHHRRHATRSRTPTAPRSRPFRTPGGAAHAMRTQRMLSARRAMRSCVEVGTWVVRIGSTK